MKKFKLYGLMFLVLGLSSLVSCKKNTNLEASANQIIKGSGAFTFTYTGLPQKPINVYYYVPEGLKENMPIVLVFHGDERNAIDYRNIWINLANQYGFMVFAPEFSESLFPGGSGYNIGNVYQDGNFPTAQTLNNESVWTFSMIEPLFDFIKNDTKNTQLTYNMFGHSAGGQFVHRFVLIKPAARFNKVIAANSGWYTVPDGFSSYPYGIMNSPIQSINAAQYFNKNLTITVGQLDNNASDASLRHNTESDLQGLNRLQRANYFFNSSIAYAKKMNTPFNWQLHLVPNSGHDANLMSIDAANILFK
jgi:pimeloyl-ACP methyl ester carboxylesterase